MATLSNRRIVTVETSGDKSSKENSLSGFVLDEQAYSTSSSRNIPGLDFQVTKSTQFKVYPVFIVTKCDTFNVAGSLPLSVTALSPRVQDIHKRVKKFIREEILPLEKDFYLYQQDHTKKWTIHPKLEPLKVCFVIVALLLVYITSLVEAHLFCCVAKGKRCRTVELISTSRE
jgi:hypothetical protein